MEPAGVSVDRQRRWNRLGYRLIITVAGWIRAVTISVSVHGITSSEIIGNVTHFNSLFCFNGFQQERTGIRKTVKRLRTFVGLFVSSADEFLNVGKDNLLILGERVLKFAPLAFHNAQPIAHVDIIQQERINLAAQPLSLILLLRFVDSLFFLTRFGGKIGMTAVSVILNNLGYSFGIRVGIKAVRFEMRKGVLPQCRFHHAAYMLSGDVGGRVGWDYHVCVTPLSYSLCYYPV